MAHDLSSQGALRGIGYKVKAIDVPDNDGAPFGKEFGNRGQCNPTYFTVGNLVKYLTRLRDEQKMPQGDRRELRVPDGRRLRPLPLRHVRHRVPQGAPRLRLRRLPRRSCSSRQGGLKQATGEEQGLEMNPEFFLAMLKAILIGDVLNALGYRIRPYEVDAGRPTSAIESSKKLIHDAFSEHKRTVAALAR